MTAKSKSSTSLSFVCLFVWLCLQTAISTSHVFGSETTGQQQTTEKGTILHTFTKGLFLPQSIRPGALAGEQDLVSWLVMNDKFSRPYKDKNLQVNFVNDTDILNWEAIQANEEGIFTGNLRRAWLYTEFESEREMTVLLEASGHSRVIINGMPQEGDHFDNNYTLIPFTLQRGLNKFLFSPGRFARVRARLVIPSQDIMFSNRDMTLPAVLRGERQSQWGAIRVINSSKTTLSGYTITTRLQTGESATIPMDQIISQTTRKVRFQLPAPRRFTRADTIPVTVILNDPNGREIHRTTFGVGQQDITRHHDRTFISQIDNSVQYFSVAPATSRLSGQALVLSLHGAGVEARGQSRAYTQKDWAHIVAPTNRRPFGFNWLEWGRLDALEVLEIAKDLYPNDPSRRYLTGHSMGGFGSWNLGATYPGKFAAIGPAAGVGHRRFEVDSATLANPHFEMITRGAKAGSTIDLIRNLSPLGVYILHGDADVIVPVEHARRMRTVLSEFHTNFVYHEQIGASHWDGPQAMDWPPMFDFMRDNIIPEIKSVNHIYFRTASPGVSATNHWVRVNQQVRHNEISTVYLRRTNDTISGTLSNVENITLFLSKLDFLTNPVVRINDQTIIAQMGKDMILNLRNGTWVEINQLDYNEKHPARSGSFKLAFTNRMVFVYATSGSEEENEWYKNKARFDAETFLYRGNGSIDIVADTDFSLEKFSGRNVILYGNASNNKAWSLLLPHSPVQVHDGKIQFGNITIAGTDLGTYFIYPRPDCIVSSVGVVAGTGTAGMKALWPNHYFVAMTGFPDLKIFGIDWLRDGIYGIKVSGFFGNDWSIENGDFKFTY
ncbi:MAG TPA: alpha/beta hydrolase-fold protein [Bacteroidales bacterium]|nr:alpha/beta hydrolase-fold protein [Bacteroidales bacterium]